MDPLLAKADEGALPSEAPLRLPSPSPRPPEEELHPLKSLGHGSIITLVGQLALIIATFGTRVLLVTYLPSALYGDLALGLSITSIVSNLAGLGIPNAVARQLAHTVDPKTRWKLVVLSLEISIPLAALSGLALYLLAPALGSVFRNDADLPVVLQFLSVNMAFGIVSGVLAAFFQGNEDALPNSLFTMIIYPALTVAFLWVALPRSADLATALWAYIVASTAMLVGITIYTLSPRGFPWRRSGSAELVHGTAPALTWVGLASFALPLALVALATSAVGTADTIVLGLFRSASDVGAYSSVLPLARLVALAVGALAYIMLPVTSRLHRLDDLAELRRSYATITKWIVMLSLPFFLVFAFLPGPSLSFVYRTTYLGEPGYGDTPLLLQITCIGSLLATVMGPSASVLIGLGRFRLLIYNTVASALVDVGLAFVLSPFLGAVGAAVAFAAATALLPMLSTAQTYHIARVHPFTPQLLKPLAVVALPVGALLAFLYGPLHWWPGSVAIVGVALLILVISLGSVAATLSIEQADGHLLEVVEEYLGRPLPTVRRIGRRFLPRGPRATRED